MIKYHKLIGISFATPIFILSMVFLCWGQYPFGDNTLLIWDMNWQYCSFFAHLHDILHGDASFFYTFSRAIGGEMPGIWGYYMMSPFNLIFYFFDAEHIYIGILIVTLLKVGTSGVSMYYFLCRKEETAGCLIFSTAYALSSYVVAYQFNIFWMDALLFLPLMISGIEKLVEKKEFLGYVLALAGAIITNFYTGYMLCIFSVIYFICYFFLISGSKKEVRTVCLYAGSSLAGGLLTAGISLPMLFVLGEGKGNTNIDMKLLLQNSSKLFGYRSLVEGSFAGMISEEQMTAGKPLIYCGVLTLMLTAYWFLNRENKWKKKLAYLILLLFLVASLSHYNLNTVWHGLNVPMGCPYRFSFLYIFLVLDIAYEGYLQLEKRLENEKRSKVMWFMIGTGVSFVLLGECARIVAERRSGVFVLNMGMIWCYVMTVIFLSKKRMRTMLCFALVCVELLCNAGYLYLNSAAYQPVKASVYDTYYQKMAPLVSQIKEDETFCRTVLTGEARRTDNDSFLFNLYGLDSYTSVENIRTMQIAVNMGFNPSIYFGIHFNTGTTKAGEALLGVKYFITSEILDDDYELQKENNGLYLYENPTALPIAFLTEPSVLSIANTDDNAFEYLNAIYESLCVDERHRIYQPVDMEMKNLYQCTQSEDGYQAIGEQSNAWVEYTIRLDSIKHVYLQYNHAGVSKAELIFNDKCFDLEETQENFIKDLGRIAPEDCVNLRFYIDDSQSFLPDQVFLYEEKENIFHLYADQVQNQKVNLDFETDSKIRIQCTNEEQKTSYLLCSIPYDKGWQIKVDGTAVAAENAAGNLLAIPVESGRHEIELNYVPRGLYAGMVLFVCTGLLIGAIGLRRKQGERFTRQP